MTITLALRANSAFRFTCRALLSALMLLTPVSTQTQTKTCPRLARVPGYGACSNIGGRNCGFVSYEQCMMTARGAGGWCEQNLFYLDQVAKQRQQPRKRPHND